MCLISISFANAQSNPDNIDMALSIWIPNNIDGLNATAKQNLQNKLSNIATKNGIIVTSGSPYVLTANVIMLSKHITPTAPAKHVYELDVTLYVGNAVEGRVFSSHSVKVKGVDNNETKAFASALSQIRVDNPDFKSFLQEAKVQMVEYFNKYCDAILKEAQMYATTQEYDRALNSLASIPRECTECWGRALAVQRDVFQRKIDNDCQSVMLVANTVWNTGLDIDAAQQATLMLSGINPGSKCYKEAQALSDKIGTRMRDIDKREWDFMNKQFDKEVELQKETIRAYRDVGVAYGKGQKPVNIIYKSFW